HRFVLPQIKQIMVVIVLAFICEICGLLPTRSHHRFKNLHIPGAAAEISRQAVANLGFVRTRILFQQINRGQNHSRSADTALRAAAFNEGLLDVMQLICRERDAFDGFDRSAVDLGDRDQTAVDDLTVNHDAARATLALAATFFGPGEMKLFAQNVEQALHGIGFERSILFVDDTAYLYFFSHRSFSYRWVTSKVPLGYLRKTQNLPPLSVAIRFKAWRKVTPRKSKDNFSVCSERPIGGRCFKFIEEAMACT